MQRFDPVLFNDQYIIDEPKKQRRGKITLKAGNSSNSFLERLLASSRDMSISGSVNFHILV